MASINWGSKTYFAIPVDPFFLRLQETTGTKDRKLIIAISEFLLLILGCALLGEALRDLVQLYVGDNQNAIQWIKGRSAGNACARFLLRLLRLIELTYGFVF